MAHILVIGGTSGIGAAVVRQLAASNHTLTVASRRGNSPEAIPGVKDVIFDALDENASLDFLPDRLDGLVYAPGSINLKPFTALQMEDFMYDMQINYFGAIRVIRAALPALRKSGNASIVLFSTVAVQQGMSFHSSIAGAKGAVEGLSRSLAAELAPSIRVNAVAPSLTRTPLADKILSNETRAEAAAKRHPLQRVGEPDDIASMVVFLLEPGSGWITGQVIGVDGGLSVVR